MLNLNYNIIGSNQKIVERQGAVFSVRNDPFSASLVVAIPGNLFFDGDYQNQFGMTTAFDDISAYIKGNGTPIGSNLSTTILSTGSFVAKPTSSLIKWADQHYNTSIYFEGSSSLAVNDTFAAYQGANLSFSSSFVIETWVAWPITASVSESNWYPSRQFAYKYDPTILSTSAYIFEPWGGDKGDGGIISGSLRFVWDYINTEYRRTGSFNNVINPNTFAHYALSYTKNDTIDPNFDRSIRLYFNGNLQGYFKVPTNIDINQDTSELLQMFGYVDTSVPAQQDVGAGTPGYFTDFRLYNGTNKNYTGSIIPLPQSMVTWG